MNHEWDNHKLYYRGENGIDSGKENLWQQIVQEKSTWENIRRKNVK